METIYVRCNGTCVHVIRLRSYSHTDTFYRVENRCYPTGIHVAMRFASLYIQYPVYKQYTSELLMFQLHQLSDFKLIFSLENIIDL